MKIKHSLYLFLILLLILPEVADAQRNRRNNRQRSNELSWPPERAYSRVSLGSALQGVFKKHYEFCGFPAASGKRDYTPPTLERFLGRRNLRTKVEQANISGGNLLSYIFLGEEVDYPLNKIRYQNSKLLALQGVGTNLIPQPREGFDAFILTKNCSGYLKSCLDAGIKPPYSAFSTALGTDERRESSVLALSGSFVSPLASLLAAKDDQTTALMAQLWLFYQAHPAYIGQAYYLSEFEGVMVRHLDNAETIFTTEQQVGVNVSLPFSARLNSELTTGRTASNSFTGTDWETIVYADFEGPYQRRSLFSPLPGPAEIAAYFANLRPNVAGANQSSLMLEGAVYQHQVRVAGLPAALARAGWRLSTSPEGVYTGDPQILNQFFQEDSGLFGMEFSLSGFPNPSLFQAPVNTGMAPPAMVYTIESQNDVGGVPLRIQVNEQLTVSKHPLVTVKRASFDLGLRDNRQFACTWTVEMVIDDSNHPLAYEKAVYVDKMKAHQGGEELPIELVETRFDANRSTLYLMVATRNSWPLDQINDQQMRSYDLQMDVYLPTQRGETPVVRQINTVIAMPSIYRQGPAAMPPSIPLYTPPVNGGGG